MKTITLHNRIKPTELFDHISKQLNTLFKEQRQADIDFVFKLNGDVIEISEPELYGDEVLFKIEIDESLLNITRSEHYVDDVNSLTVESILNDLFKDIAGNPGTDLLQEG